MTYFGLAISHLSLTNSNYVSKFVVLFVDETNYSLIIKLVDKISKSVADVTIGESRGQIKCKCNYISRKLVHNLRDTYTLVLVHIVCKMKPLSISVEKKLPNSQIPLFVLIFELSNSLLILSFKSLFSTFLIFISLHSFYITKFNKKIFNNNCV